MDTNVDDDDLDPRKPTVFKPRRVEAITSKGLIHRLASNPVLLRRVVGFVNVLESMDDESVEMLLG